MAWPQRAVGLANWLTFAGIVPVAAMAAWQIRRDWRKDRAEQEQAAIDAALRDARTEQRLRDLEEERARDND